MFAVWMYLVTSFPNHIISSPKQGMTIQVGAVLPNGHGHITIIGAPAYLMHLVAHKHCG